MAARPPSPPSFTPHRRWRIGFDLTLRTGLVLAVLVMANYLGAQYFKRFYLSSQTRIQLSSRTVNVLQGLTNGVKVTVYYDPQGENGEFYPTILALLKEFQNANRKITVRTVDYIRNAGEAEKVKEQYKLTSDKDLVIFDLDGHLAIVDGGLLTQYAIKNAGKVAGEKELAFTKTAVSFSGEVTFTSRLLALENPAPRKAYFLQGDQEVSLSGTGQTDGYLTFGLILGQNYLSVTNLELFGDHDVPADCDLLIIAAPKQPLENIELQKIQRYLADGGRLFVLLDFNTYLQPTGLEPLLQHWGINVMYDYVKDLDNTITGQDIKVQNFGNHPIVAGLAGKSMHLILPRPVGAMNWANPPANAPDVQELAFSGAKSTLARDVSAPKQSYSLIAVSEQKAPVGVVNPRGNTRIVAAGDSVFLANYYIEDVANRDFLDSSINWLIDRSSLVSGNAPQNITEYRLVMTQKQQRQIRWVLLGALPGVVLLVGGFVWLLRRK